MRLFLRLSFLLIFQLFYGQEKEYQIRYFTTENGLGSNSVFEIVKSSNNFMWFGTSEGLTKFDGYDFTNYQQQLSIYDIQESDDNILWCATNKGLLGFDLISESFLKIPNIIRHRVHKIEITNNNNIWIASHKGLYKFSYDSIHALKKGTFSLKHYNKRTNKLPTNELLSITSTPDGLLWIGTKKDYIFSFSPKTSQITKVDIPYDHLKKMDIDKIIAKSIQYYNHQLFIGTRDYGLIHYDIKNKKTNLYLNKEFGVNNRDTYDCIISENMIWTATWNGIQKLVKSKGNNSYTIEKSKNALFSNQSQNIVRTLFYDQTGVLWAGTLGSGVIKIDFYHPENEYITFEKPFSVTNFHKDNEDNLYLFSLYNHVKKSSISKINTKDFKKVVYSNFNDYLGSNVILCSAKDKKGNIWYGGHRPEINKIISNGKIKKLPITIDGFENPKIRIRSLLFDHLNNIWIGTSNGLVYYDSKEKIFTKIENLKQKKSSQSAFIVSLYQDKQKFIWVGTRNGIFKIQMQSKNNRTVKKIHDRIAVRCITESDNGKIYFGTGRALYSCTNDRISEITTNQLSNKGINCLVSNKNLLWIGTNSGISSYNEKDNKIKNFYIGTHINSAYKNNDKQLFFGTKNGFIKIDATKEYKNKTIPKTRITSLKINGKKINKGETYNEQLILTKPISNATEIELNYENRNFELEFSSLSYLFQDKNKYAFQLEGYETDWKYSSLKKHTINYQNLPPGAYTFKVKACNNDGVWNSNPTQLKIVILPAWWETWWFKTFIVLFLCSSITFIYLIKVGQNYKKQQLEYAIEKATLQAEKEKEISELKINFFTNLSHEIRTPLTLIISPLKDLIETANLEGEVITKLQHIHKNSKRLLKIINQLLDFKKIENKQLHMNYTKADINAFVKKTIHLFSEKAKRKEIKLRLTASTDEFWVEFDAKYIETVIVNLLSNALKFTPNKGKVTIEINQEDNKYCSIIVSDTGIGIAKKYLNKLFDRFYQVPNQKQNGSGIGLSLVKEIIDLHKGNIKVVSEVDKGTSFEIKIPITQHQIEINSKDTEEQTPSNSKETILIIEDTEELLEYTSSLFRETYHIVTAKDGEEGLEKANSTLPSLIISDVMMPRMDGIELCEKLKSNDTTSYIPLILLTAKTSDVDKIRGLESGADDYMIKPFNSEILKLKVENFIANKKNTKAYFQQKIDPQKATSQIEVKPEEQKFINNAIEIIEKHLTNSDFNAFMLAEELHMSKATLYRRIKSFTDLSINHFIRSVRIKKSAEYILTKEYTIKEISFMVGYSNNDLFRKYFVEQFGVTPSKYEKSNSD